MSDFDRDDGVNRRKVLECMTWVGTGVLWTISGGVPHSLGIMGEAQAQDVKGLTFLQISDSHVGFDKPANPNALGTLQEAVSKIIALPQKPAFMIHTGDISHLSLESQFDDADRIISQTKLDVHYVPGEHDFLDPEQKFYRERYGRGTKGAGWYSFDANGVHFIGLVNVVDLKAGGLGNLGNDQLEWLEADVKGRSASTPIVVFAHIPLWTVYPDWGWGTEDGAQALSYLKKFGSVTVLNGHIHQVMQKVEGNVGRAAARHHRHAAQGLRRAKMMRSALVAAVLGAVVGSGLAGGVLVAKAATPATAVSIDNFTFTPQTLTVKAGTTVTWTNKDDIPHGIAATNNAFTRSKALDTDDSYSFTFTTPGSYQYFCYVHPHMTGTIVVEAASGSNASN